MAIPTGFWTAGLEGTVARLNQCLIQFDTTANRPAAATKGMLYWSTDDSILSYDDGASWNTIPTGSGAIIREGGQTTEATSTSTTAVDLLAAASLTIATNEPFEASVVMRKTSGAAAFYGWGVKLNSTVTGEANSAGGHVLATTSNTNQAEGRAGLIHSSARITNYIHGLTAFTSGATDGGQATGGRPDVDADMPIATITDIIIRGKSASTSITGGADELQVYSKAAS